MMRFILLVLLAAAAWYGWKHYPEILHRQPGHEALIQNHTGREMLRVRLSVDGQTFVKESIPDEGDAVIPFKVAKDASFDLLWAYKDNTEHRWSGGLVPKGPMTQRHVISVDGDDGVMYHAENK